MLLYNCIVSVPHPPLCSCAHHCNICYCHCVSKKGKVMCLEAMLLYNFIVSVRHSVFCSSAHHCHICYCHCVTKKGKLMFLEAKLLNNFIVSVSYSVFCSCVLIIVTFVIAIVYLRKVRQCF